MVMIDIDDRRNILTFNPDPGLDISYVIFGGKTLLVKQSLFLQVK